MRTLVGKVVAITGRRKRELDAAAKDIGQYVTVRPQGAPYGALGPVTTPQEESMKTVLGILRIVRPRLCAHVAPSIPHARRSRSPASPSAPRVIRGGLAGRSRSRPQGGWKNSAGGMRGTTRTPKHDTARLGVARAIVRHRATCID